MRGHAAAYANAAAAAAMAAAQIAVGRVTSSEVTQPSGPVTPLYQQMPQVLPSPPEFSPQPLAMTAGMNPSAENAGYLGGGTMSTWNTSNGPSYNYYPEDGNFSREDSGRKRGSRRSGKRNRHRRVPLSQQSMMDSMSISRMASENIDEYGPINDDPSYVEYAPQQQRFNTHPNSSCKRGRRSSRRSWNETTSSGDSEHTTGGSSMTYAPVRTNNTGTTSTTRRRRSKKLALMASSSSDGSSASLIANKKRRQGIATSSWLGKTASSILYEFCSKRRDDCPIFVFTTKVILNGDRDGGNDDFELDGDADEQIIRTDGRGGLLHQASVSLNGEEIAKGFGLQKAQAKQDASRRALQHLLPGVEFDEKGLLSKVPETISESGTSVTSSCIVDNKSTLAAPTANSLMSLVEQQLAIGRADDDGTSSDEGSYNDCQKPKDTWEIALLNKLLHNDPRLIEAPVYTYKSYVAGTPSTKMDHECTAELKVFFAPDGSRRKVRSSFVTFHILKAKVSSRTKREAKQSVDARLLELLFPHCVGVKEIKAAADILIMNQKNRLFSLKRDDDHTPSQFIFGTAVDNSHKLPSYLEARMVPIFGDTHQATSSSGYVKNQPTMRNAVDDLSATHGETGGKLGVIASRRQQLDESVQAALQKLNDHDEEGRLRLSISDQLGDDDVGRTVLRTAQLPGDTHWLESLLKRPLAKKGTTKQYRCSIFGEERDTVPGTTIVLLLCRAIAPYEDPPLGCAVVSTGFSLRRGKLLRIVDISSEAHLPRERFLECLESFASCLGCALEYSPPSSSHVTKESSDIIILSRSDLQDVFIDYIQPRLEDSSPRKKEVHFQQKQFLTYDRRQRERLQSVKEVIEEEETDRSKKRSKSNND